MFCLCDWSDVYRCFLKSSRAPDWSFQITDSSLSSRRAWPPSSTMDGCLFFWGTCVAVFLLVLLLARWESSFKLIRDVFCWSEMGFRKAREAYNELLVTFKSANRCWKKLSMNVTRYLNSFIPPSRRTCRGIFHKWWHNKQVCNLNVGIELILYFLCLF